MTIEEAEGRASYCKPENVSKEEASSDPMPYPIKCESSSGRYEKANEKANEEATKRQTKCPKMRRTKSESYSSSITDPVHRFTPDLMRHPFFGILHIDEKMKVPIRRVPI